MSKILTAEGASKFEIPAEYREFMVLFEDGRLLVAHDKKDDHFILSFQMKASRLLSKNVKIEFSDLKGIKAAYESDRTVSRAGDETSGIQERALDMFKEALELQASDIHIIVNKHFTEVKYRINNDLRFIRELPSAEGKAMCAAIYTSLTDQSEQTFTESARQSARVSDPKRLPPGLFGLRIEKVPQVNGIYMVLRLLYTQEKAIGLRQLGFTPQQAAQMHLMMQAPWGINIISGPTGSGKSRTLQSALTDVYRMKGGRSNMISVEDPVEYLIDGAIQIPVFADNEAKKAEAFLAILASILRLDPDIIMIGEMRELSTARATFQAAMTGHQVWTTVHANSALNILDRLVDMGVPLSTLCDPTLITGLIAQRLVKTLCPHCKTSFKTAMPKLPKSLVMRVRKSCQEDVEHIFVKGQGCEACGDSGISGRIAVPEIIIPDMTLFDHLRKGDKVSAMKHWINEQGGHNMLSTAIMRVREGLVDPLDAEAVVGLLTMDMVTEDGSIKMSEVEDDLVGAYSDVGGLI